jgi:hypothetical protein
MKLPDQPNDGPHDLVHVFAVALDDNTLVI